MKNLTPPCTYCGQRKVINPNSDMPAMVGMPAGNRIVSLCCDCIIRLGKKEITMDEVLKK